jgi:MFS transporter, DHA1 family, multidrug resistance protein
MTQSFARHWAGPVWLLSALLASMGALAPFAIDAYLPAFGDMALSLRATPVQLQQTLSFYLLTYAVMNLFHGALADSFGRRRVVLWAVSGFVVASVACALARSIEQLIAFRALQGLTGGVGTVVARAIVRDLFAPVQAQKAMSQMSLFFGLAPAVAPLVGGQFSQSWGWAAVFWMLAALGGLIFAAAWRWLPETLEPAKRQPFNARSLFSGYRMLLGNPRFLAVTMASSLPFNAFFLYVLSAPVWLGEIMALKPTQFFYFFVVNIAGLSVGAFLSGRLAGRMHPAAQLRLGFAVMGSAVLAHVACCVWWPANLVASLLLLAVASGGWALFTPIVNLVLLDMAPQRRGMAASVQAFLSSLSNSLVAGVLAPWVMHGNAQLAWASMALTAAGLAAWGWARMPLHHGFKAEP